MMWRLKQFGKMVSAKRYILLAIVMGIGLWFLIWWLLHEPMPQTVPDRSIKI